MSAPGDANTEDLWPSKNANLRNLQKATTQFIFMQAAILATISS